MAGGNDAAVDRSQVETFLKKCIDQMKSEDVRKKMKDPSSGRPSMKLVEIQKRVWDDMGISTDTGRAAVSGIERQFPDNAAELVALRADFAKSIDAAYLQCLEDRRPSTLKKKGKMPRNVILDFCECSNLKLDMPEVQERLRKEIQETGKMPDSAVNDLHDEVMELLGFDREHGQTCFKDLGNSKEFAKDRDVAVGFARWRGKTSSVCFKLLNDHRKEGGELNLDDEARGKVFEVQAKDELGTMSIEERSTLLEKNAKKVNVFRMLPDEARKRYLEKLSEDDKLELAKSEMLMVTLMQSQQQMQGRSME